MCEFTLALSRGIRAANPVFRNIRDARAYDLILFDLLAERAKCIVSLFNVDGSTKATFVSFGVLALKMMAYHTTVWKSLCT